MLRGRYEATEQPDRVNAANRDWATLRDENPRTRLSSTRTRHSSTSASRRVVAPA